MLPMIFEVSGFAAFAANGDRSVRDLIVPKRWQAFQWNAAAFRRVWSALDNSRDADLELPKFTLRSREHLNGVLGKLRLDLNDPRLFEGMLMSDEPLGIEIHEAFIQVDETSTEAAAAT